MVRVVTLALKAYWAPFADGLAFIRLFWPAFIPGFAVVYLLNSLAAPAPAPAAASDPAATAAVSSVGSSYLVPLLVAFILLVLLLANSTFLWHRRLILGEAPRSIHLGVGGVRRFIGRYLLLGLAFFAIMAVITGLALLYPADVGLPAIDAAPEAETAIYFYIITVGCLLFAILCARLSRSLPRLAVKGDPRIEANISEASVWQAIQLPAVIFLTTWPLLAAIYLLKSKFPALPAAFELIGFVYLPAVFAGGLSLYYNEFLKPSDSGAPGS